jgi:hypothetical protein
MPGAKSQRVVEESWHLARVPAMRGKRMVLDDRECRSEKEILRWGKVLTLP